MELNRPDVTAVKVIPFLQDKIIFKVIEEAEGDVR